MKENANSLFLGCQQNKSFIKHFQNRAEGWGLTWYWELFGVIGGSLNKSGTRI
jgi:hypothetical protein